MILDVSRLYFQNSFLVVSNFIDHGFIHNYKNLLHFHNDDLEIYPSYGQLLDNLPLVLGTYPACGCHVCSGIAFARVAHVQLHCTHHGSEEGHTPGAAVEGSHLLHQQ